MDINKNIICIKTATNMFSGIMYPCESVKGKYDNTSFVIFTNKHAVDDLPINSDLVKLVDFIIYDKHGKEIKKLKEQDIELILFYDEMNDSEDIAVFYLSIPHRVEIDLESKILWDDSGLDEILIEGFPKILSDNSISSKMQLQGKNKAIFPPNNKIGIFQITDDYHWYSNYKDMKLFEGFSGSPVYMKDENKNFLVGMNQSVLNIKNGENPFKLIYYYKMKYILRYLREKECIIYNRNQDGSVSIRWINNKENKTNEENKTNNINLLLLGASGAGKSSFIKTFLWNADFVNSVNDGQTTRSNIIYQVGNKLNNNEKPHAYIKFLTKNDFICRMKQLNYLRYLCKIMSLQKSNTKDEFNTTEDCLKYIYFELLKDEKDENKETKQKEKQNIETILKTFDKKDYESNHNYYGNVCDIIGDIVSMYDFSEVLEKNKKDIDEVLNNVDGFFYIREFEFLKDNIKIEIFSDNKITVFSYFEEYYKKVYENIMKLLISNGLAKDKDYSYNVIFDNTDDRKEILQLCLQVIEGKSLTGIVDYVKIIDYVSENYAYIFDDLNISYIHLIDTFGLDHASWDEDKGKVLSNIIYDLVEKCIVKFDSDLAIIYVKKLDSGKPTEIQNILPQIYNFIPQSPVYCVFNGLDIFLGNDVNWFNDCETYYETVKKPKSIAYLESEYGKNEILSKFSNNNQFITYLYTTLKNNLVSFCSDIEKITSNYKLFENNKKQIYKLLLSICMKEYSSLNIVPDDVIRNINNDKYKNAISNMIEEIFQNASMKNWEIMHHKTCEANFIRLSKRKLLGYWGTYEHRWDQLFHRGYIKMIASREGNFLNVEANEGVIIAIDSCIRNMEDMFIDSKSLVHFDNNNKDDNSKFRKLIENMYKKGVEEKKYMYNPFEEKKDVDKDNIVNYLVNICNFEIGFEYIKDDLYEYFKNTLLKCIELENRKKKENLQKINFNFYLEYQKLRYEFEKKYENLKLDVIISKNEDIMPE